MASALVVEIGVFYAPSAGLLVGSSLPVFDGTKSSPRIIYEYFARQVSEGKHRLSIVVSKAQSDWKSPGRLKTGGRRGPEFRGTTSGRN
jgi:hypothetical protein